MSTIRHTDEQWIVRVAGWTGASKLIGQILTFGTTLFLVRLLDKDDFGLFAMVVLYILVIDNLADFGFQSAIIQRKELDEDSLSSCFWLLFGVSLIIVTLSQVIATCIAGLFAEERLAALVRQVSWIFLMLPFTVVSAGILSWRLRLDAIAKTELGTGLLRCATSIVLAFAGMGVLSLVYGYLVERIVLGVILTYLAGWKPRLRFVYPSVKPLITFGLNITASKLLWLGYSKMDTFVVGRCLGVEVLGVYSVALQIAMAFSQFVSAAYYRVVFSLLSRSQDSPGFSRIVLKSSVYLSMATLPIMVGTAVVAPDIVLVFLGDNWHDAIPALQVLSLVAATLTLSGLLPQAMNAMGRADMSIWINLASLIVFGIGFYLGAQWRGITGVLIVWLFVAPLRYVVNVFTACSLLRMSVTKYLVQHSGSFMATLVMLPVVMIVAEATGTWPAASRLVLCVGIGAAAYLTLSFFFMRQPCLELLAMLKIPAKDTA
jgi:teichuronic acid exporter